uniref:Mfa1 family fimbria major subunit n=1 Tax=Segatella copri TaxID=165179 RepID=UPI003567ACEC
MKIKHFFGLAVIAAMTASCSSNEDLGTAGPGTGTNEAGVGYATFTINLPSTNGTRAGNPTYDQGTLDEYDVNDVTLLIFKKGDATKEDDFTFVEKADLGNMAPWKDENNSGGITASATITAKLTGVALTGEGSTTSDYYALAILNNKNSKGEDKITLPTKPTTESTTPPVTYGKWNAASNADEAKFKDNKKGFYMANAPVYIKNGEPTTLVNIDKVYATKQKAETNAATTIHVERGLAKVTVAALPTNITPSGTKYTSDKVDITAWKLDVTNKSTFPIHKTAGLTTNFATIWSASTEAAPSTGRFVDGTNTAFQRVHWGIDPNYSDNKYYDGDATTSPKKTALDCCKDAFNMITNDQVDGAAGEANPQYCLENTFDLNNMKQGQTTRVVFKATYTPSVLNSPSETDKTFFMIGNSTDIWTTKTLKDQIASKAKEALSITTDPTVELTGDLLTAGTHVLTKSNVSIKIKEGETETEKVDDKLVATLNTKLGLDKDKGIGIKTYKNGESYYIARIKHFGALTPWEEGQETYGINNDDNNKKYLGRYGVLRNNWYELTVGKVSGPGTPDVPTIKPEEPDDESYKYISVSVKILSWAKRTDTVDL